MKVYDLLLRPLILTILSLLSVSAFAQECGTQPMDSIDFVNQPWYGNNDTLQVMLEKMGYYQSGQKSGVALGSSEKFVPVTAWVWNNDAANGDVITNAQLHSYISQLNIWFNNNNAELQFIVCTINRNNDSRYYDVSTDDDLDDMWEFNRTAGTLNMHFCNDLSYGSQPAGVARFPSATVNYVLALNTGVSDTANIANTLTHEVGHALGLSHTHECRDCASDDYNRDAGNCKQESVSRTRTQGIPCSNYQSKKCNVNGDALCDTEADPGLIDDNGVSLVQTCDTYTGTVTQDNWGDTWTPPFTNFMSYAPKGCRNTFSPGQVAVMYNTVTTGGYLDYVSQEKTIIGTVNSGEVDDFSNFRIKTGSSYTVSNNGTSTLEAEDRVLLVPGFSAVPGSNFNAIIAADATCSSAGHRPAGNTSEPSRSISAKKANITSDDDDQLSSLSDVHNSQGISIYPNPSQSGVFTLRMGDNDQISGLQVTNAFGKIVCHQQGRVQSRINLESEPKGIYFVRIELADTIYIQKIIYQ